MATKSISQLDSASTMALGDLLEIAEPNAQSVSGYTSKKISIGSQLAPYIQETVQNASLNTTDKTLVGAINEVQSNITSAINDLDVASTSIGQGETLATIKEENGKIAVTKQDIKIGLGQIDSFCCCGTNDVISGSNTWHKVASVTPPAATRVDYILMLSVTDNYFPNAIDDISNAGILYCRVRQTTGGGVDSVTYSDLKFVANSGLNPSNFRLYYKTDANGITFEIWTSMKNRYAWRRFSVISQGDRTSVYSNEWTLYNSTSPAAAPTESATCVRVECEDNICKKTEIAPSEYSDNASQSYGIGDYMFWKGGFYKVTASISSGGSITLNTNVTKTTIGAELKAALNA